MNSEIVTVIAMILLLSGAIVFLAWQLMTIFVDQIKEKNHKKLKSDIETAISNGDPTWEHVKVIESTYTLLNNNSLKNNLRNILKGKVLAGTKDNSENIKTLEEWLEKQTSDEPFEGIPSELKLPLERIRKEAPEHQHLLEMLVAQLQEFNEKSQSEKRRKGIVSTLSLLFGIAGFLVGAYQVYDNFAETEAPNKSIQPTANAAAD